MWCLHNIDFKVNYTEDCPTSGRDFTTTTTNKKSKQKEQKTKTKTKKHVCPSALIYFFRPVTSKTLFLCQLIVCLHIWLRFLLFIMFTDSLNDRSCMNFAYD